VIPAPMAELLGVVASGIAVTQAANLLGGLVVSLSRLWYVNPSEFVSGAYL
jgi:hypothetical protein